MLTIETVRNHINLAWPYVEQYGPQLLSIVIGVALWNVIKRSFLRVSKLPRRIKRWRVKSSRNVIQHLRTLESPGLIFSYLRQRVDPFMFEELLLTAFEQKGHSIKRNKRYTGDGGIDGQVKIDGQWHLIQAKRYQNTIRPSDVKAFSNLCNERGKPGLFIHTGRTGPASRHLANQCPKVSFLSGSKLIELFTDS